MFLHYKNFIFYILYEILQRYLPTSIPRLGLEKSHLSAVSYEAIRATVHATKILDIEILFQKKGGSIE